MTTRTCSLQECDRPHYAQGFCQIHYQRWRRTGGDPGPAVISEYRKAAKLECSEEGCSTAVYAKMLCRRHYNIAGGYSEYTGRGRKWRTGERRWEGVKCQVPGCEELVRTAGFCGMHYNRVRKHGTPGGIESIKAKYGTGHINQNGYREIADPLRPGKKGLEHRIVMERTLGRALFPGENVHHINGVRDDNREDNLELWVTSQPAGQRPTDLVAWAHEILDRYGDLVEGR